MEEPFHEALLLAVVHSGLYESTTQHVISLVAIQNISPSSKGFAELALSLGGAGLCSSGFFFGGRPLFGGIVASGAVTLTQHTGFATFFKAD